MNQNNRQIGLYEADGSKLERCESSGWCTNIIYSGTDTCACAKTTNTNILLFQHTIARACMCPRCVWRAWNDTRQCDTLPPNKWYLFQFHLFNFLIKRRTISERSHVYRTRVRGAMCVCVCRIGDTSCDTHTHYTIGCIYNITFIQGNNPIWEGKKSVSEAKMKKERKKTACLDDDYISHIMRPSLCDFFANK